MVGSKMLVLLLVCFAVNEAALYHYGHYHHHGGHFRNVAYGKNAIQSSRYDSHKYPASNAVNGLLTDFSHTNTEKSPWLRIDLGRNYEIHEIEVFTRKDCCGGRLHDVDVKVGKRPYLMGFCGHFSGPTKIGQKFSVWCPSNTIGRYVEIQIVGGSENVLDPAEVVVWGHL
ncbi:fucolectin-like [Saccostrea echinata]|uniref:fucolectin-like n=1 Tax=Saccostrea echinata TaxID=191078 RepID=UPI002A813712|nr:fucolectin-like [Saccostrea echinata]